MCLARIKLGDSTTQGLVAGIPKLVVIQRDELLYTWRTSGDYFEPKKIKDSIVAVHLSFLRLFWPLQAF